MQRYQCLVSDVPQNNVFSMNMYLALGMDTTLFYKALSVVLSAVGVLTYPEYLMIYIPMFIRYGWVHLFEGGSLSQCGHM